MKKIALASIAVITTVLNLTASESTVSEEVPRATMKSNSQVVYNDTPGEVDGFFDMFSEGKFYGRLRSNTFYFWWDAQDTKHDIHLISGLGGSLVYKSAVSHGFDFGGALYYSHGFFNDKDDPAIGLKAGKDAFGRYEFVNTGSKNLAVLGQAYIRYQPTQKSEIIAGRQLVETFYTKSNDTKMIPNTFDGLVLTSRDIPDTYLNLSYLAQQKLRDHVEAHSVLMVGDANSTGSIRPEWSENDDGAMHKGLTYTALKASGKSTKAPLITGDFKNRGVKNLSLDASFYVVPELLAQGMGEINYNIDFGSFSMIPGFRYIRQFDNGAGTVGGASIKGGATEIDPKGYKNPDSLDSQMIAARLVTKFSDYKINLAYTNILDEADLVTPWRGFPTSGYTRSMARYNWRANTKSYRAEFVRSTSDAGLYNDLFIQASILYQDDDAKKYEGINTDSFYYYFGLMQNLAVLDNAQWRFRLGYQDFVEEKSINNIDTRFEINYFF